MYIVAQLKIGNNIIANAGFIKQFGRQGGSGVQALDPTWGKLTCTTITMNSLMLTIMNSVYMDFPPRWSTFSYTESKAKTNQIRTSVKLLPFSTSIGKPCCLRCALLPSCLTADPCRFSDRFGRKACLGLAWLWLAVVSSEQAE
jgi:hypothetical protein